ncbi:hypothetical protein K431DRAFT_35972 [Polychaeton citri CBS 116435]|uniref:Uncharacterized protein n=1 Tax=Polychaeton citri CBS 116435 TaxID=1314669 RepID=A0A9P4QB11_9PEZI|nr:hypothetical protein K431DRAFT_35972 [Polychaeton citri CBS 116435]
MPNWREAYSFCLLNALLFSQTYLPWKYVSISYVLVFSYAPNRSRHDSAVFEGFILVLAKVQIPSCLHFKINLQGTISNA